MCVDIRLQWLQNSPLFFLTGASSFSSSSGDSSLENTQIGQRALNSGMKKILCRNGGSGLLVWWWKGSAAGDEHHSLRMRRRGKFLSEWKCWLRGDLVFFRALFSLILQLLSSLVVVVAMTWSHPLPIITQLLGMVSDRNQESLSLWLSPTNFHSNNKSCSILILFELQR